MYFNAKHNPTEFKTRAGVQFGEKDNNAGAIDLALMPWLMHRHKAPRPCHQVLTGGQEGQRGEFLCCIYSAGCLTSYRHTTRPYHLRPWQSPLSRKCGLSAGDTQHSDPQKAHDRRAMQSRATLYRGRVHSPCQPRFAPDISAVDYATFLLTVASRRSLSTADSHRKNPSPTNAYAKREWTGRSAYTPPARSRLPPCQANKCAADCAYRTIRHADHLYCCKTWDTP